MTKKDDLNDNLFCSFCGKNQKEVKKLRLKMSSLKYKKEEEEIRTVKGISILIKKVEDLTNAELRELADSLKQKLGSGVVVLGMASAEKVFLVASVTKDLTERISADTIIKNMAPLIGGGGGGRPDFAQAGGTKPGQLDKILNAIPSEIEKLIK